MSKIVSDRRKIWTPEATDQIKNSMYYLSCGYTFQCVNYRVFHGEKNLQKNSNKRIGIVQSRHLRCPPPHRHISSLKNNPQIPLLNLSHASHRGSCVTYILSFIRDKLTNVCRIVRKCTILIFSDFLSFSFQFM